MPTSPQWHLQERIGDCSFLHNGDVSPPTVA
jgi:hypothetical protein